MVLTPDLWRRVDTLLTTESSSIPTMLRAVDLDPSVALKNADLRGCDLRGENMTGFDLTGADLADAMLAGANVTRAIFTHANLAGADLSDVTGLDQAIGLNDAHSDPRTKWPRPSWADAAGRDAFGPWVSFTVTAKDGARVTQRLRWCPPSATPFRMGSPPKEEGRYDDEDQSDPITLAQGFWVFETPCTQALWMAVMDGNNPSHFPEPERPVENVSFRDVRRFIRALNGTKRGLGMTLPSEAQWEYACRAGTDEATYAGPALIRGRENTRVLDRIAWYDHNSKGETHPVGLKEPNAWGLRDMLGNVFEWCADEWHDNHAGARRDGVARDSGDKAARRVVRGGSWGGDARYVRAALRSWLGPGDRYEGLGFRCVRGLGVSQAKSERRDAGPGKRRERSDQVARAGIARRAGGGT